jgi:hypothetical protein
MENAQHNAAILFPKPKKRGAKVRIGPCARIIPFPGIYIGDELEERFEWIKDHGDDWETTYTEGTKPVNWRLRAIAEGMRVADGIAPLTDHEKRARIATGRALIETRNRIKAYLERRGVDLDTIRRPEDALFQLFALVEPQL